MNSYSLASEELFFENLIWLNSKEAAEYLRTSVAQIRNWVYQGKIRAHRIFDRKLLFKKSDLDAVVTPQGGQNGD